MAPKVVFDTKSSVGTQSAVETKSNVGRFGHPLASFNQLSTSERESAHAYLKDQLVRDETAEGDEAVTELDEFVSWAQKHPGQIWKGDKKEHREALVKAMLHPKYSVSQGHAAPHVFGNMRVHACARLPAHLRTCTHARLHAHR